MFIETLIALRVAGLLSLRRRLVCGGPKSDHQGGTQHGRLRELVKHFHLSEPLGTQQTDRRQGIDTKVGDLQESLDAVHACCSRNSLGNDAV